MGKTAWNRNVQASRQITEASVNLSTFFRVM